MVRCYHRLMRAESELIPYATGRLDGSPLLVLAPHPDDEVFGCGAVMVQTTAGGGDVRTVVLTDGAAQGDPGERRAESREAARRLGVPEPRFWGLRDRSLNAEDPHLLARLEELMLDVRPRVVLVPSPAEIHPDHRALALAVYGVLQRATVGTDLHASVEAARLAAYEVSAVLRPNLLVDITQEWDRLVEAASAFASQQLVRPYLAVLEGLSAARRLTLPETVERAAAYHVVDLRYIRTHSVAEWAACQGPSADLEPVDDAARIDVVIRTRNRPQLLSQALTSVAAQISPPGRVIVVNDGGTSVNVVSAEFEGRLQLEIVDLDPSRGRSGAAQIGLERATTSHVVFLDDDDLMLPDHLLVLGRSISGGAVVPYSEAVQGLWQPEGDGGLRPVSRHRTFGGAFDPKLLTLVNYIPLLTVAIPRELAVEVGGFDPDLDLYEDWDLLLRLVERTPFVHLPRVTCEYRVIPDTSGITGANPPGSKGQLDALLSIWRRHRLLDRPRDFTAAMMRLVAARDRAAETARGLDEQLLDSLGVRDGLTREVRRLETDVAHLRRQQVEDRARQQGEDRARQQGEELGRLRADVDRLYQSNQQLMDANRELADSGERTGAEGRALRAEVERLNGMLELIYRSRTWKLHRFLERLRGGGR